MLTQSKFRLDIQVIRGVALVAVLFYHAKSNFFPLGFLGVDVFFVVSGFVVTPLVMDIFARGYSWGDVRPRFTEFYRRRFLRLAPSLSASLLLTIALIFFFAPIQDHRRISFQGLLSIFGLSNFGAIYFSGDYFSPHPNALIHTWSLSVEEQIYLTLPIFMFLSFWLLPKVLYSPKLILFSLTFVSFLLFLWPSLLHQIYIEIFGVNGAQFHFYSPLTRIWQFTLGSLVYFARGKVQIRGRYAAPTCRFALFIGLFLVLFNPLLINSNLLVVLVTLLSAFSIHFKAFESAPKFISNTLGWLGNRSYSIYLLHLPLIYLAKYSPIFGADGSRSRQWQTLSALVISVLLGSVFYSKIENRFRETSHNRNIVKVSNLQAVSFLMVPTIVFASIILIPYQSKLGDPNLPPISSSIPWEEDSDCKILRNDLSTETKPCIYPGQGEKSILLFGDSHAASYVQSFRKLARNNNLNLFVATYSDCPFLLSTDGYSDGGNVSYFSAKCLRHNQEVLKFVEMNKIEVAFYAQRARMEDGDSKIIDSLFELHSSQADVVVIGMNPEYLPVTSILGNLFSHQGRFNQDVKTVDNYWKTYSQDREIQYIDVFSHFCPNSQCRTKEGSRFLFFDDNHLSNLGASKISQEIQLILRAIES